MRKEQPTLSSRQGVVLGGGDGLLHPAFAGAAIRATPPPNSLASFTYTVLDGGGRLYIVRGNNPFCLYHWPERGLYLYASTQAVLDAAVFKIRKLLSGSMQKIPVEEGEILRLSPDGSRASETFSMKKLYQFQLCQSPYYGSCWPDVQDNTGYAEELRRMAPAFGFSAKDVDTLLRGGMLPEEIEEYFYCTEGREDVWFGMCSDS